MRRTVRERRALPLGGWWPSRDPRPRRLGATGAPIPRRMSSTVALPKARWTLAEFLPGTGGVRSQGLRRMIGDTGEGDRAARPSIPRPSWPCPPARPRRRGGRATRGHSKWPTHATTRECELELGARRASADAQIAPPTSAPVTGDRAAQREGRARLAMANSAPDAQVSLGRVLVSRGSMPGEA